MKYILHEMRISTIFHRPFHRQNFAAPQTLLRTSAFGCCARLGRLCNDGNRSRRRQREPGGDWQQRFAQGESQFGENRIHHREDRGSGDRVSVSSNNNCQRARGRRRRFIFTRSECTA